MSFRIKTPDLTWLNVAAGGMRSSLPPGLKESIGGAKAERARTGVFRGTLALGGTGLADSQRCLPSDISESLRLIGPRQEERQGDLQARRWHFETDSDPARILVEGLERAREIGLGARTQTDRMGSIRILVAHADDSVRESICQLLNGESGWTICAESAVGKDAVAAAALMKPDVVVLGVGMPDMSGVQVANQIRSHLSTPIVFITTHDATAIMRSAAGGDREGAARFMDAVRAVMPQPPRPAHNLRERRMLRERRRQARHDPREGGVLTPREREVLHLLAEGHTNKQIAARLSITPKTAETHRARINAKLKLRSVSDLVRYAIRNHIIEP